MTRQARLGDFMKCHTAEPRSSKNELIELVHFFLLVYYSLMALSDAMYPTRNRFSKVALCSYITQ